MLYTVVVVVILALGAYLIWGGTGTGGTETAEEETATGGSAIAEDAPAFNQEQLLGRQELSTEQKTDVSVHKQEILDLVKSGRLLTDAEKSELGDIMLTKAHLYNFTPEERESVFAAVRMK